MLLLLKLTGPEIPNQSTFFRLFVLAWGCDCCSFLHLNSSRDLLCITLVIYVRLGFLYIAFFCPFVLLVEVGFLSILKDRTNLLALVLQQPALEMSRHTYVGLNLSTLT